MVSYATSKDIVDFKRLLELLRNRCLYSTWMKKNTCFMRSMWYGIIGIIVAKEWVKERQGLKMTIDCNTNVPKIEASKL